MKTKHWIILFAGLLVLSAAAYAGITRITREEKIASIYRGDELIDTVDLDRVEEAYSLTVTGDSGAENVILVEPGQISVASANCPDQLCVNHAPISDGIEPIVCLPHRLIIRIEKTAGDGADTWTGG